MPPYTPGEQPVPGRRVIKLNTNENPYPPSPAVLAALHAATAETIRLYPDPEARELRRLAAALYRVDPAQILVGNGSDELLALLLRATVDPGDRVAFPTPTYSLYETLVAVQGGETVCVPFGPDFVLPEALARTRARVTFLCNPNSPSGTRASREMVERIVQAVDGLVVLDEAYVDFAAEHLMDLVGRYPNVVVLRTLSKSYSLAGLRIGLLVGRAELVHGLRTVKDSYNVNRLSLVAGEAALADQATMRANVARVVTTRARLTEELARLGYEVLPSEANFVLARRRGVDQAPIAVALAARDILVRHFGALPDALRITVGADAEIDALLAALSSLVG